MGLARQRSNCLNRRHRRGLQRLQEWPAVRFAATDTHADGSSHAGGGLAQAK
jgi:hypothetical protein